jgi:hypothetical protein
MTLKTPQADTPDVAPQHAIYANLVDEILPVNKA